MDPLISRLRDFSTEYTGSVEVEENPYAMFFVVNDDKNVTLITEDVLLAVAEATIFMVTSTDYKEQVDAWLRQRIRKLVKRGRNKAWDDLEKLAHIEVEVGTAKVRVFPPTPVQDVAAEVKKLQVVGLNTIPASQVETYDTYLSVSYDATLNMTTGKAAAQGGHAVQLFLMKADEDKITTWLNSGSKIVFNFVENLNELPYDIEVHDAGFTEVASGSKTAIAKLIV